MINRHYMRAGSILLIYITVTHLSHFIWLVCRGFISSSFAYQWLYAIYRAYRKLLKVPKCEIFDRSNFHDFYTIKSLREGDIEIPYAYAQSNFREDSPFKTCSAYASVTDAYPEHTGQELMRSLSMRIRNWCTCWAFASVPCADAQHKRKNSIFEKGLQTMPCIRVRNWCVHWACA
jgi:hypothetical protein